jgi:GlpG protein
MRQIGTLTNEVEARRLGDYLLTLEITSRIDSAKEGWVVWVHREELLDQARQEFAEFVKNPTDPKFMGVEQTARAVRKRLEQEQKEHARNTINMRGRRNYRPLNRCPLTYGLMSMCVTVALLANFGPYDNPIVNGLYITQIRYVPVTTVVDSEDGQQHTRTDMKEAWTDLESVKHGQVWRLLTPMFLHFGIIHILFNMVVLYDLGGMIELRKGTWRLAVFVLLFSVASNLAQYLVTGDPRFGGMSGVLYGLFGYTWMKGHYNPDGGLTLRESTIYAMLIWFGVCLIGYIPHVANAGHAGGLLAGALIGIAPHIRQELKRW